MSRNTEAKIAYTDIETLPAQVYTFSLYKPIIGIDQVIDSGRIAGFGWQWHGEKKVTWYSEFDMGREAMIQKAHDLMDEADIIVHWNGISFDEPWFQAEFLREGLAPPSPTKQVDLMKVARKRLKLISYKLDYVARYLGLGQKVHTGGFSLWRDCLDGDPKAWKKMGTYCQHDVRLTGWIYDKLLPWIDTHPNVNLYADADNIQADACRKCGGSDLRREGFAYTTMGKYQQYQCRTCGGWCRGNKALGRVTVA